MHRYQYNGKEKLSELGINNYDYGARHYDAALGRWFTVDPMAEKYKAWSAYNYTYDNPANNIDPDGRSVWSKVAKVGFKVGKTALKEGVQSLRKGATWADAVSDIIDDVATVANSSASPLDRVVSGLSLASELLPISAGDVKDLYKGGKKLLGVVDEVKDITKRPGSFRKKTVSNDWDDAADGSKSNTKQCPTCGKDVEGNPNNNESRNGENGWDVSHNPSWSKRDLSEKKTRKEVLDEYNKGTELECIGCNRGRGNRDAKNPRNPNQ